VRGPARVVVHDRLVIEIGEIQGAVRADAPCRWAGTRRHVRR
jgi:hypothetical protein